MSLHSLNDPSRAPETRPLAAIPRLRHWLGLERNILVMLAALLTLGMGEELWSRFIPKYLELLGGSAWAIAVYGTLKDLLDAIYPYPGGWLTDRLGRRAALMLFALLAVLGYAIYLLSPSWTWVLFGTLFVMAWSSLTLPAIFAIIGDNLPRSQRAIGFGVQSILKRAPIVVAPAIGGLLIASLGLGQGMRLGFGFSILLALAGTAIVRRYYVETVPPASRRLRFGELWRRLDSGLKRLLVADCLARWASGIANVFVVLYVLNVLEGTAFQFGWLTGLQMLVSILVYIPASKLADRWNRKPFILLTFLFFALFPIALARASSLGWLVVAFAVAGLREIGEPARKALIVDLARAEARGREVGLYYLIRGLIVFPASLVGGWLWSLDPQMLFYGAAIVGLLAVGAYALLGPADAPQRAGQG